jgi:hypothetical protein
MPFLYKFRCQCFNKSVFNWTFCQLLHRKFEPLDCLVVRSVSKEDKPNCTKIYYDRQMMIIMNDACTINVS